MLADSARAVDEYLVEPAPLRLVVILVAEMPFAEDAGSVTRGLEHLRQGDRVERQALAFEDGMGDAVLELMAPGDERAAGGRTRRTDMEVREAHALVMQAVHVGRLEDGIAVGGNIAVALVVGQDENDVRPFAVDAIRMQRTGDQ